MSNLFQYKAHYLELEQSNIFFAVLVMAHLRTQKVNQDFVGRFR
ncbi:hypothetical protein [Nostoc sp. PCC 9305]